ncbi:MAG: uracil-DNA glycosylase [Desulfobacteraceae bacterium Eth-SRB1]|nr:MAG: uracil-DNA glycosylase [Desulfobacteraceae bacterium Eth-SRB1]
MTNNRELNIVVEEAKNYLCFLAETGCTGFECLKKSLDTIDKWGKKEVLLKETLETIRIDLGDCRRCKLSNSRKNIVFGAGSPSARLVFVGEGPGFEEDKTGKPFVGAAGKLLTKIIQAIKLTREQVYICNIIKCRPPGNRNPELDEIKACFPFLERQIVALKPDFICTLGLFATQTLLETKEPISKLRGHFRDYKGIKLLPTYHPAYLLRNPDKKRDVWEDMKKLMNEMGE